jgi:hypothetical protein
MTAAPGVIALNRAVADKIAAVVFVVAGDLTKLVIAPAFYTALLPPRLASVGASQAEHRRHDDQADRQRGVAQESVCRG